jgi:uncharacterized protein (TIGR04255 family)
MSPHYSKAPIIEAVLDFGVKSVPGFMPTQLNHFQVNLDASGASAPQKTSIGYSGANTGLKQAYQVRPNGFTFSKQAPYKDWETFSAEAKRLWNVYREVIQPSAVTRLAVRYINRLELPLPVLDFKDWLRTVPEVSPDMTQNLNTMVLQFQNPETDLLAVLNFTEAIVPPTSPQFCSIVLDIDLFREVDLPNDEVGIWSLLDKFRERKNKIFEACITDQTRRLIQ